VLKQSEDGLAKSLTSLRGSFNAVVKDDVEGVEKVMEDFTKLLREEEGEVGDAAKSLVQAFQREVEEEKLRRSAQQTGRTVGSSVWQKIEGARLERLYDRLEKKL